MIYEEKDPDAKLDYQMDWSDWLVGDDTISSSSWSVDSSGLTLTNDTSTDTTTTVWIDGGTVGETYLVTNSIVTSEGREDDRTIRVTIIER